MAIIVTEFCDKLLCRGEMSEGQKFDFLGTKNCENFELTKIFVTTTSQVFGFRNKKIP